MRAKMAKRNTRTTPTRSQANHTSAPADPSPATDPSADVSAMGGSADRESFIRDDVDDSTRAVSMASEPPERSTAELDEEQVRYRAYQRFLDRGGSHGG